jgi:hypothetical protein
MADKKRPYRAPRLTRAGSFEELTQVGGGNRWDNLVIFGMRGNADIDALS